MHLFIFLGCKVLGFKRVFFFFGSPGYQYTFLSDMSLDFSTLDDIYKFLTKEKMYGSYTISCLPILGELDYTLILDYL